MKYIGIRGHRGAGKSTVAWLLGNTLEYLKSSSDFKQYKNEFDTWCQKIKLFSFNDCVHSSNMQYVIFEEFGDGPKMLLQMLTGISMDDMDDQYKKDHILFNMKTFESVTVKDEELDNYHPVTAEEYAGRILFIEAPGVVSTDVWMTLRELIVYFGVNVMANAFGINVWIKSLNANSRYYEGLFPNDSRGFKIFSDVKARTEVTYIKDHDGIVIKVERPNHKKPGGLGLLRGDSRFDYEVIISTEDLNDLSQTIWDLANNIISES